MTVAPDHMRVFAFEDVCVNHPAENFFHEAASRGVVIENTGSEPLVGLRYFGPDTHQKVPNVGDAGK